MDQCGTEALCTQCGAKIAHIYPEDLAARIHERDQARDVAGWRQGDEYDRTGERRAAEAWHAAHENAKEVVRQQERAEHAEAELLRCLKAHEADRAAAFEAGMRSVLRQRCIEHRDVPQLNNAAIGGPEGNGECGACVLGSACAALKLATDALTVARGWAIDDADARAIAVALKAVIDVRVVAEDKFA